MLIKYPIIAVLPIESIRNGWIDILNKDHHLFSNINWRKYLIGREYINCTGNVIIISEVSIVSNKMEAILRKIFCLPIVMKIHFELTDNIVALHEFKTLISDAVLNNVVLDEESKMEIIGKVNRSFSYRQIIRILQKALDGLVDSDPNVALLTL